MKNKTRYRIKFVSGEFSGRSFAINEAGLKIGRAVDADLRCSSKYIDAEHLTLLPQDSTDGLLLHVHTTAEILLNGEKITSSQLTILNPGDDIQMGQGETFVVEINDFTPSMAVNANAIATEADTEETTDTGDADDNPKSKKTSPNVTRYASPYELAELKHSRRNLNSNGKMLILLGGFVSIMIVATAWFISNQEENPATWPGTVEGIFNDGEFETTIDPFGSCLVYYPITPYTQVNEDGNNCDIMTSLGKDMDIPFHISFTVRTIPNGMHVRRKASFDQWVANAAAQSGFTFSEYPKEEFYRRKHGGIPFYSMYYTRKTENLEWGGYVNYMRYYDKEIVLLREVPEKYIYRAKSILKYYSCFVIMSSMENNFWDIPEKYETADSQQLLKKIASDLQKNLTNVSWESLDQTFYTILCRAYEQQDKSLWQTAHTYWLEYRDKQQVWLMQTHIAYKHYEQMEEPEQMKQIWEDALRKFYSTSDYRHFMLLNMKDPTEL